ncbi:ubiquitin carboxyl-terminal hydrolase MINDY-3 homolog [Schistocerca americana]|uniref:ubiquitin carboxyl-terminal hydrolase MINDY-3 homolog n=1 Tax=Schistocerca americana TaxID=7009 RepID=UPI001F4F4C71|nr:ubiquitin carboxyl-terminal hydrolase MINDY-3 homolog [Schistocerca americana]
MGRLVVGARGSAKGGAMSADLEDVRHLLWGRSGGKDPVFRSWSQGFSFSPHEPTALVQLEGGPCAVLAAVQAFILRSILCQRDSLDWRRVDPDGVDQLLIDAVTHIVCQHSTSLIHTNAKHKEIDHDFFHEELRVLPLETRAEVRHFFATHVSALRGTYGVLLLLYSLLASRGPANLLLEVNDPSEPLIDPEHGYGGQSLINLMLTGRAVSNVWDGDRHIDGMLLRGIERQSEVGFLTVMERARHCEVGACLKSPRQPVWLLASETHLTVLFSAERRLAGDWAPTEQARRVFRQFDADGGGFVPRALLPDVLAALGMTADGDFTDVLCEQLDPDGCGVVLESAFLRELCPPSEPLPSSFILYHYNGLSGSAPDGKVVYRVAQAFLEDEQDARSYEERPPVDILGCLQTKWPAIRLRWLAGAPPSLN